MLRVIQRVFAILKHSLFINIVANATKGDFMAVLEKRKLSYLCSLAWVFVILSRGALAAPGGDGNGCPIAGPEDARVVIEEFVDFSCKYCASGAQTMKKIVADYPNQVKLVLRNFPLAFHDKALVAAKAFSAVCLQSPKTAHAFQEVIFNNQEKFNREGESFLFDEAEKLGLNISQMQSDMNGIVVSEQITADQRKAAILKIKGTPSYLIGKELVEGSLPYDEIKKVVEKQLGN